MPDTLLKKALLVRLSYKDKYKICAAVADILAKTYSLPIMAIYAGNTNKLNRMGVNENTNNDINLPVLLPFSSFKDSSLETSTQNQMIRACFYEFDPWKIGLVFGGSDTIRIKQAEVELTPFMATLSSLLIPLLVQEFNQPEPTYIQELQQKFIQSMMDLNVFVSFILRLLLVYFDADFATVELKYLKKKITIETGNPQNQNYSIDFNGLKIFSRKSIVTVPQTQSAMKLVIFYLHKILRRYFRPRISPLFYLNHIMDLTRIYESLFSLTPGLLDTKLEIADYLANKTELSTKGLVLLHWLIGTEEVGRIILRSSSQIHDKRYIEENQNDVRIQVIKNLSLLIENYELLIQNSSPLQSILTSAQFYFDFIHHCTPYDLENLQERMDQAGIPEHFKSFLAEKIFSIRDMTCSQFRSCPESFQDICPNRDNQQLCYQQESVFCSHFHQKCQECLFYLFHHEYKGMRYD